MDYIPHDTQAIQPPAIAWHIEGAQSLEPTVLRPLLGTDAQASGEAVVKAYKDHGILAVRVRIDGSDQQRTIWITEGHIRARGQYARYLPDGRLTQNALDTAIARAQSEARANNEALYIQIGQVDQDGGVDVVLGGKPNEGSGRNAMLSATSYGPRYSGSDVLILSGSSAMGNGVAVDASATVGLPDLRKDSRGGHYVGLSAGVSKATEYGVFSLRGSHSRFKVGGPNVDLDQTGDVTKGEAEWSYAVNANITPFVGLAVTHQVSRIGAVDWSDTVTSTALKAGVRGQKTFGTGYGLGQLTGDVTVEQGLTASRRLKAPGNLLGDVNPHYSVVSGNMDLSLPVSQEGATLSFSGGVQRATEGTPSGSQFYAGGPGRGASYHSGVYAGPNGFYGGVQWTSAVLDRHLSFTDASGVHDVKAYVGVNGAQVRSPGSKPLTAKSLQLGVSFVVSKSIVGQIGIAQPIGGTAMDKPRLTFFLSSVF